MEEHLEIPQKVGEVSPHEKSKPEGSTKEAHYDSNKNILYYNSLLQWLDSVDKDISAPMFQFQLPFYLECLLSVPGNFFGVPVFSTAVAPGIVAWMAADDSPPQWWCCLILTAFIFVLSTWIVVLSEARPRAVCILFGIKGSILSPFVGVALVSCMGSEFRYAQEIGYFQLSAWCFAVIPIALLKPLCKRSRPVTFERHAKHLHVIFRWLYKDGLRSFPSGDVAGAVAFAYPIYRCQVVPRPVALLFPILSGIGRMYWQAHHFADVLVGALLALPFCYLLELLVHVNQGCSCCAPWWVPFASQFLLACVVAATRKVLKVKVFSSGVIQTNGVQKVK